LRPRRIPSTIFGTSITNREAAACLALVTAKTERDYAIMAFSDRFMPLDIAGCARLTDVVARTSNLPFEGTDCSLPSTWALEHQAEVDAFVVMTDSETWAGATHPSQALVHYRHRTNIPARSAVVSFESNGFSIADPRDAGMLDCVGFDKALPTVLGDFIRG
jgi:60 kDa SS-A/Ro ribonucleoprotein